MVSSNFPFPKGNSNGEGYHYWKTQMQIFIDAIDLNIWEAIEIGPFIPTMVVGNATIEKPREQ